MLLNGARGRNHATVLVTGATGFVGRLVVCALLQMTECRLLLPARPKYAPETILAQLRREMSLGAWPIPEGWEKRVAVLALPDIEQLSEIDGAVREAGVEEVIYCAACIDYFAGAQLQRVNVEGTRLLLSKCLEWGIARMTYISTAFSAGYRNLPIAEALPLDEPDQDPTEYTRTKREAERLVAQSGLAFLCLRPPIIIGDSRDGHYTGKQYGLYQLYAGIDRLLSGAWEPEFHVIGTDEPVHLLHQDAFQQVFLSAWRQAPHGAFVNMISDPGLAPTGRDLWRLWFRDVFGPDRVYFYDGIDGIPLQSIPRRQRAFVALASVNMEIAAYPWRFERPLYLSLAENGDVAATTLESVAICQAAFVRQSDRIRAFRAQIKLRATMPDEFIGTLTPATFAESLSSASP